MAGTTGKFKLPGVGKAGEVLGGFAARAVKAIEGAASKPKAEIPAVAPKIVEAPVAPVAAPVAPAPSSVAAIATGKPVKPRAPRGPNESTIGKHLLDAEDMITAGVLKPSEVLTYMQSKLPNLTEQRLSKTLENTGRTKPGISLETESQLPIARAAAKKQARIDRTNIVDESTKDVLAERFAKLPQAERQSAETIIASKQAAADEALNRKLAENTSLVEAARPGLASRIAKNPIAQLAASSALYTAPQYIEENPTVMGVEVPVKGALKFAGQALAAKQGLTAAKRFNKAGRNERLMEKVAGEKPIAGAVNTALQAAGVAGGLYGFATGANDIKNRVFGKTEANAAEDVLAPQAPSVSTPQAPVVTADTTPEDIVAQHDNATAANNASTGDKVNKVVADNGGIDNTIAAATAGDQTLALTLAAIKAEHDAAQTAIDKAYQGAYDRVNSYQTQANTLLQDVAAKQAAGFAAAAGGLQNQAAPSGVSPEMAAAMGLSAESVGGAGITAGSLAASQAAAGSVAQAAEQLRAGTTLSDQAAQAALDQASAQADLEQNTLASTSAARIAAAKTAETARQQAIAAATQERQFQQQESRLAAANAATIAAEKARLDAQYGTGSSGTGNFSGLPSWAGTVETAADPNTPITLKGLPTSKPRVTAGEVNVLLNQFDSYALDPKATNPRTAYAYWSNVYSTLSKAPATGVVLKAYGRPISAAEMMKSLGIATGR